MGFFICQLIFILEIKVEGMVILKLVDQDDRKGKSFKIGYNKICEKVQKSLIPYLPAPPSFGTGAGRQVL
jgi:hypothetical protein